MSYISCPTPDTTYHCPACITLAENVEQGEMIIYKRNGSLLNRFMQSLSFHSIYSANLLKRRSPSVLQL